MKIILTEKEMYGLKKAWDNTKDICTSDENRNKLNDIENKIADKVSVSENGERTFNFKEEDIVEGLLASAYILDETKDAAQDLDRSYRMMKGKWTEVGLKIVSFAMKTFILKSPFTRSFYNSLSYYIASFKSAYDKALTMGFSLKIIKESDKDKNADVMPDDPEVAKEQWGTL